MADKQAAEMNWPISPESSASNRPPSGPRPAPAASSAGRGTIASAPLLIRLLLPLPVCGFCERGPTAPLCVCFCDVCGAVVARCGDGGARWRSSDLPSLPRRAPADTRRTHFRTLMAVQIDPRTGSKRRTPHGAANGCRGGGPTARRWRRRRRWWRNRRPRNDATAAARGSVFAEGVESPFWRCGGDMRRVCEWAAANGAVQRRDKAIFSRRPTGALVVIVVGRHVTT